MPAEPSTLALVESPVQLLHVIEWCAWHQTRDLQVAVLSPREGHGRFQLAAMRRIAERSGLTVAWLEPRLSWRGPLSALLELRRRAEKVERVLVGDPFSGLIQMVLTTSRIGKVVVLDDGTATIDFADSLAAKLPLSRWAVRTAPSAHVVRAGLARRAGRFFAGLNPGTFEVFTAMPVDVRGAEVTRHSYGWTRATYGPPPVTDEVTVIGSSLVESGLFTESAYLTAIEEAVRTAGGGGVYIRHRRERDEKLARLAERTGLELVSSEFPLEIELRRGPVGRQVVCFPSSPAFTLPLVLSDAGVKLTVLPARPDWFQAGAGRRATDFVTRLSGQSPASPSGAAGD